jgi:hypothetical protein
LAQHFKAINSASRKDVFKYTLLGVGVFIIWFVLCGHVCNIIVYYLGIQSPPLGLSEV